MKYVFFTNSMGGYSGGPTYVRNKLIYLKDKGWEVQVFDGTGFSNINIEMEQLKEFAGNRYQELFYNPYWLREPRREKIISTIIEKIGTDDNIVIESNCPVMSIWGELISSRIGAKHLVYLISEKLKVSDSSLYQYYKYKAGRNELFSIGTNAYTNLFSKFENVSDANQHYWLASIYVPIEDVECEELNNVKRADYNIGHFGRWKGYFDEMFKGVADFANKHIDKSVNFILLGDAIISKELKNQLPSNVSMYQLNARQPIPKMFFDKTDVVIATAGCANISARYGAKVISMDVYNKTPLGVLGYNTLDANIRSDGNKYKKTLSETLEDIFVNCLYKSKPQLENKRDSKGFEYQLRCASLSDRQYYDVHNLILPMKSLYTIITKILLSFNMVALCSAIRYRIAPH